MKKLLSRKFLVSLGAIIASSISSSSYSPYIIIGIAIIYVLAETVLDRLGIPVASVKVIEGEGPSSTSTSITVSGSPDSKPEELANAIARSLASNPPPSTTSPAETSSTAPPTSPSATSTATSVLTGLVLVMLAVGCGTARPACSYVVLAEIEAAYTKEIVTKCKGQDFDTCSARPAIEAENAKQREEWARCQ